MTFSDHCISVTDLKKNASKYIKTINETGTLIIFVNNKPVAELSPLDPKWIYIKEPFEFDFWPDWVDAEVLLEKMRNA